MKKRRFAIKLKIFAIAAGSLIAGMFLALAFETFAFVGPSSNPSTGSGAISTDAANEVGIGTSTPQSGTMLIVVGSTSDATTYGVSVEEKNQTDALVVRDDGAVSIETSTFSAGNTIVGGNLTVGGTLTAGNLGGSTFTAGNISSGQFGSNTGGGNYSFPANVSIATTTASGGALTVVGTTTDIGNLNLNGNTLLFSTAANGYTAGYSSANSNIVLTANTTGVLKIGNNAFTISSVNTSTFAGVVGIGTTTAPDALTVTAPTSTPLLNVGNVTAPSALYVATSGNVVIGTTTVPAGNVVSSTLNVYGNMAMVPNGALNGTIDFGAAYATSALILYDGGASTTNWGWGLNSGQMEFYGTQGSGVGNVVSFNYGGNLQPKGTNQKFTINLLTGDVGIGTSAPSSTLHVVGNVQFNGSSSVITAAFGGSSLATSTCASANTAVDSTIATSSAFVTEPTTYLNPAYFDWSTQWSSAGTITTSVCNKSSVLAETPTSTTYVVKIIK